MWDRQLLLLFSSSGVISVTPAYYCSWCYWRGQTMTYLTSQVHSEVLLWVGCHSLLLWFLWVSSKPCGFQYVKAAVCFSSLTSLIQLLLLQCARGLTPCRRVTIVMIHCHDQSNLGWQGFIWLVLHLRAGTQRWSWCRGLGGMGLTGLLLIDCSACILVEPRTLLLWVFPRFTHRIPWSFPCTSVQLYS